MAYFLEINMDRKLIVSFQLPPQDSLHIFRSYKVTVHHCSIIIVQLIIVHHCLIIVQLFQIMPRSQNALAIVNAAFSVKLGIDGCIDSISIVYGNIAPDFIHATETEAYLKGKKLSSNQTVQRAIELLNNEIVPVNSPPEPSPWARKKLAIGLFYKVA